MRDFEVEIIGIIRSLAQGGQISLGVSQAALTPQTRVSDLDLDSLELECLAMELSERYGIDLPNAAYSGDPSLGEVAMMLAVRRLNPDAEL